MNDREYFCRRAGQERQTAVRPATMMAFRAHMTMVREYERRVRVGCEAEEMITSAWLTEHSGGAVSTAAKQDLYLHVTGHSRRVYPHYDDREEDQSVRGAYLDAKIFTFPSDGGIIAKDLAGVSNGGGSRVRTH